MKGQEGRNQLKELVRGEGGMFIQFLAPKIALPYLS